MRLKEYINEMEEVHFVKKMIDSKSKELYNVLNAHDWVVTNNTLVKKLNKVFKDYNIVFEIGSNKKQLYDTVIEAEIDSDNTKVDVKLPKDISIFFRRFAKPDKKNMFMNVRKNQFFSELLNILSHEYRHMTQIVDFPGIEYMGYENDDYLENKAELDAFSLQAALEYLKLKKPGKIIKMYQDHYSTDSKIYRNFITKVERYKAKLKKLNIDKVF